MARYGTPFDPDTSHGHAVALVERADLPRGLVLDLGCGQATVAEPLAALGFDYLGVDTDPEALADLRAREIESHGIDLAADPDELVPLLLELVADRPVAAILALDVLEHLPEPARALEAIATVADTAAGSPPLVVSYPNITHFDVAAKLLVGTWHTTDEGLLDRTHLHFVGEPELRRTMAAAGWREVDAHDVRAIHTEQCDPIDAPVLRPGAPLRDLLWRVRELAEPNGTTYQFVRRFERSERSAPERATTREPTAALLTVVVTVDAGRVGELAGLLEGLTPQMGTDVEVLVVAAKEDLDEVRRVAGAESGGREPPLVRMLTTAPDVPAVTTGLEAARGRYVALLTAGDRVGPDWIAGFRHGAEAAPGRVLVAVPVPGADPTSTAGEEPSFVERFLDVLPLWSTRRDPASYAVPRTVVSVHGLVPDPSHGDVAVPVFLTRAALWSGLHRLEQRTVAEPDPVGRDRATEVERTLKALDDDVIVLPPGWTGFVAELRDLLHVRQEEVERLHGELHASRTAYEAKEQQLGELEERLGAVITERDSQLAQVVEEREALIRDNAILNEWIERRLRRRIRRKLDQLRARRTRR